MTQNPFRFLISPKRVAALCAALERIGLRMVEQTGQDLTFTAASLSGPVRLHWDLAWWPDGDVQEDARITLVFDGQVLVDLDVRELLRAKLRQPLAEEIIQQLAHACEQLSEHQPRDAFANDSKNEPPPLLDGAKVLWWAWSGARPFGLMRYADDTHPPIEIYGIAICSYDSVQFYRFSCDAEWSVQNDSVWGSEDEAKVIPEQYKGAPIAWRRALRA